jgi:hypothetical protein
VAKKTLFATVAALGAPPSLSTAVATPLWPSSCLVVGFIELVEWCRVSRSRGLPQSGSSSSSTTWAERRRPPGPSAGILRWSGVGENGVPRCGVTGRTRGSARLRRRGRRRRWNAGRSSSPASRVYDGRAPSVSAVGLVFSRAGRAVGGSGLWAERLLRVGPVRLGNVFFVFIYFTDLMLDSNIYISWLVAPNDMVQNVLCSMWGLVYYKNIKCAMFCDELNNY